MKCRVDRISKQINKIKSKVKGNGEKFFRAVKGFTFLEIILGMRSVDVM